VPVLAQREEPLSSKLDKLEVARVHTTDIDARKKEFETVATLFDIGNRSELLFEP
jgi:hypothetical protein